MATANNHAKLMLTCLEQQGSVRSPYTAVAVIIRVGQAGVFNTLLGQELGLGCRMAAWFVGPVRMEDAVLGTCPEI